MLSLAMPLAARPDKDVNFGINQYDDDDNDESDVEMEEPIQPMPSLGARELLLSGATSAIYVSPSGVTAAAATDAVAADNGVADNVNFTAETQRLPSGHISQRQEQDSNIRVTNLSHKQRLKCARE
jgi:hypothetical protein